jgi:hypothetical protein
MAEVYVNQNAPNTELTLGTIKTHMSTGVAWTDALDPLLHMLSHAGAKWLRYSDPAAFLCIYV